jgi:nicotinamidase-related amidase
MAELDLEPRRTALLVMDYQIDILGMVGDGAGELLARMAATIRTARERKIQIGYVRVAFTEADYGAVPAANLGFSALKASGRFREGTPGTAIHPTVAPQAGDIGVRKTRVGAFSTTDLDRQLRAGGVDTLVLAGISTSGVVLSTVRAGADMDYRLVVIADCCADLDAEVHRVLTTKVFPRQAVVVDAAAFGGG